MIKFSGSHWILQMIFLATEGGKEIKVIGIVEETENEIMEETGEEKQIEIEIETEKEIEKEKETKIEINTVKRIGPVNESVTMTTKIEGGYYN